MEEVRPLSRGSWTGEPGPIREIGPGVGVGGDHAGDPEAARGRPIDPAAGATLRGALQLVAVGMALGILANALGLAEHPPRGIAWIGIPAALPRLESLPPAALAPGAAATAPGSGAQAAPPAAGARATGAEASSAPAQGGEAAPPARPRPRAGTSASAAPGEAGAPAHRGSAATPPAPAPDPTAAAPRTAHAEAPPQIPDVPGPLSLELASFKQLFDARVAMIVDAREAAEYAEGHIEGAISLPYNDALAEPDRVARLDPGGRPIVVYCSGATCSLSLDLANLLVHAGKRRVLVYEGGYPEWSAAGFPVARGAGAGGSP